MKITLEMIEAKNPCEEGLAWFNKNYPGGEVGYQELLNATAEDNELNYGIWLLDNIGPDMRVETKLHSANISGDLLVAGNLTCIDSLNVDGYLYVGGNLNVAGSIYVKEEINVKRQILVGADIAGERITAEGITAGGYIHAWRELNATKRGIQSGKSIITNYIESYRDIIATDSISAAYGIYAGGAIKSGNTITAFMNIRAGEYIEAGDYITTSSNYSIFAGVKLSIEDRKTYGYIASKSKPRNIASGVWIERK